MQSISHLRAGEGTDLSNWRTPPFSTWAFQHVREIIASATIESAPANPQRLAVESRSLDGFRLASTDGSSLGLDAFLQATSTDGLVVLLDGQIVHEFYDHGMTPRTSHILMSASKSIVGLIVGILRGNGQLYLDAPVSDLVPEIATTAYRGATLRHLLDMRTGVVFDESDLRAYSAATNWDPVPDGARTTDLHAFFENMTAAFNPHGGPFRYVSANTDLLGWAIERATGKRFAELAAELLWNPLGAENDASITLDRKGAPRCTGGLSTTARDLARVGHLMMQGGRRGAHQVIPSEWIDDISQNGDRQAWKDGEFAQGFGGRSMSYRGGWYVIHDEPRTLFAMGIHGQNLFIDRANRLVIAKLSSQGSPIDYGAVALTHRAVPEFRRCLLG